MHKPFTGHFLTLFTSETNQIENINFTYNDTRELFETGRLMAYTGDLRAALSVANNKEVAEYLNNALESKVPVTPELICEVHRLLMFASMDDHRYHDNGERAGAYKVHDYGVGQLSVGSSPEEVPGDMESLCDELIGSKADRLTAAFLCHFEHIHPFADGNGRVGRWVANYILVLNGELPIVFYSEDKKELYAALEWFDKTGDYTPMLVYINNQQAKSIAATREIRGRSSNE